MLAFTGAARIDDVGFGEHDEVVGGNVDGVDRIADLEHTLLSTPMTSEVGQS